VSDLKKVYVARGPGDAHLLRGLLESEGIQVVVRGDDFVPLQGGGLFHLETRPSLWVLDSPDKDDLTRALEIAREYQQRTAEETGTDSAGQDDWVCPGCQEPVETQFTECWNCGASRP